MSTHLLFTVELPLEPDFDGVYRSGSSPSWLLLLDGVFGVASTASSNNIDDNLFFFGETERFKDIGDLAGVGGEYLNEISIRICYFGQTALHRQKHFAEMLLVYHFVEMVLVFRVLSLVSH